MKARPIVFSAPMIRAIIEGRKTQTRRVVKPPPEENSHGSVLWWDGDELLTESTYRCPYGAPGDQLWVRENWKTLKGWDSVPPSSLPSYDDPIPVCYPADCYCDPVIADIESWGRVRPSIHMPRWASRISLEIVSVRVERLNVITEEDAIDEGVDLRRLSGCQDGCASCDDRTPTETFRDLWQSINGPESWGSNPWVWVVEFRKMEGRAEL